jgi:hypothetical protein
LGAVLTHFALVEESSMTRAQRLLATRGYWLLVAAASLLPPVYCYGQTHCYAQQITEQLSNQSLTWNAITQMYTYSYYVTINFNCSGGTTNYWTVREVDTVYQWNGSMYAWYASAGTSDSAVACSSMNNQFTWNGTVNLPPNGSFKISCTYKAYTVNSPCDNPAGWTQGAFNYFPSGNWGG